jgi:hypothetical protein
MSTVFTNIFNVNGVVDTSKSVMSNLQNIANACNTWVTFDNTSGKWSVIINRDGSSVVSIDESHIVGSMTVSGTGVNEFYNSVQFTYPHKDLLDQNDTVTLSIPSADRFPNEFDNVLNFTADMINDPIQAEYVASVELKQSRIDKVIRFNTDFSMLGVKAGDLVSITNSVYGFDNKQFRILTVAEEDGDDNVLTLGFTAYEHDATIYDLGGLVREERSAVNNVISQCANTATQASNGVATGNSLLSGLAGPAGALLLTSLLNSLLGSPTLKKAMAANGSGIVGSTFSAPTLDVTDMTGTSPTVFGTFNQFDEFDFECPADGYYTFQAIVEFGENPATNESVSTLKSILLAVFEDGYYTGDTGGSGVAMLTTAETIAAATVTVDGTAVGLGYTTDYLGDQYSQVQTVFLCPLVAGTRYYVSTFVAGGGTIEALSSKFIEVRATNIGYQTA